MAKKWTDSEKQVVKRLLTEGKTARQIAAYLGDCSKKAIFCLVERDADLKAVGFNKIVIPKLCKMDGCDKPVVGWGMCNKHYRRWKKHRDPNFRLIPYPENKGDCFQWLLDHAEFDSDLCLAWPFNCDQHGRAKIRTNGKCTAAARIMCEIAHGEPPADRLLAAHSCGNGHLGCVNPRHLRWATPVENMEDKARHDRDGKPTDFYEEAA
ncbi:MAG: hypothetical protein ACTHJQ_22735 [Rhizobiaceae bacterium]